MIYPETVITSVWKRVPSVRDATMGVLNWHKNATPLPLQRFDDILKPVDLSVPQRSLTHTKFTLREQIELLMAIQQKHASMGEFIAVKKPVQLLEILDQYDATIPICNYLPFLTKQHPSSVHHEWLQELHRFITDYGITSRPSVTFWRTGDICMPIVAFHIAPYDIYDYGIQHGAEEVRNLLGSINEASTRLKVNNNHSCSNSSRSSF